MDGPLSEETLLDGLTALRTRIRGNLAMLSEVCAALGVERSEVEPLLRALEKRGMITCAPAQGPVNVVCLPEAGVRGRAASGLNQRNRTLHPGPD